MLSRRGNVAENCGGEDTAYKLLNLCSNVKVVSVLAGNLFGVVIL